MLRLIRSRRAVRAALLLGAALTVTGSVGLHAEPAEATLVRTSAGAALTVPPPAQLAPHVCVVCLLHFSASLAPTSGPPQAPMPAHDPLAFTSAALVARVDLGPHAGRAPPSLF